MAIGYCGTKDFKVVNTTYDKNRRILILDAELNWRIRNPNVKRFTFRQNHVSGFIERRLDFFLISNMLQESIIRADVLASFCTDHSPIFFSLQLKDMPTRGKGFWKFNNSLTSNNDYVEKMKTKFLKLYVCLTKTK